jgi:hypothetical protein
MRRDIVWEWTRGEGLEHCVVLATHSAIGLSGMAVVEHRGEAVTVRYQLRCTPTWEFQEAQVSNNRVGRQRHLQVSRWADGTWWINGLAAPELNGCDDIDLMASPVTNVLPIRRLDLLQRRGSAKIDAAWVRLEELDVVKVRQQYTYLRPGADGTHAVQYTSLDSGFSADLTVDTDGLVITYPPYWKRREAHPLN